jgi:hypothetical protein
MKALVLALVTVALLFAQTGGGETAFTAHEIATGLRGGARMPMLYTASVDGASWSKRALDSEGGMAAAGCAAVDLNADKRADIVCIGTATANLKWYENAGKK